MMIIKEEEIKEHLISSNPEFRRLVEEHRQYEGKLDRTAQPPPLERAGSPRRNAA